MPDHHKRFESMLFDYGTTGRTDFRGGKITEEIKTVYKEKPGCLRIRPPPLKNLHTLTDWRIPNVPFDLFGKPKDIVRTNPRIVQETFTKPPDLERESIQKSRPRVFMRPAVSMDDIDEKESRDLLMNDVYLTSSALAQAAAASAFSSIRAPFPGTPAPANPITLPALQPPYVSPEWRMDSVSWDNRQLRTFCDATAEFWLARTPKCNVCQLTAKREKQRKMAMKIQK